MSKAKRYVQGLIDRARAAQEKFENWPQEKVDEAVRSIGKAVYDEAGPLAKLAIEETGMGKYEDKVLKNMSKPKVVWAKIKGIKSRGILRHIDDEGLVEVSKPMGIIGAIIPMTNPTVTPVSNAMIALKGGNALVVSPHPRGAKTGKATVDIMREALKKIGVPEDLILIAPEPTIEISQLIMSLCDACIATGGPGMVKAAYSSGKPSFGVGPGNLQCVIDVDIDLKKVVPMVVNGRIFDNGLLCTCEQSAICARDQFDEIAKLLQSEGGYLVAEDEMDDFRYKLFPGGKLNMQVVGKEATEVADICGLKSVPPDTKLLFVQVNKFGSDELFTKEKLCPVLCTIPYDTWEDAVNITKTNLTFEGTGHSVIIHSNSKAHIEELGKTLLVSRLLVNQQGSSGLGGALNNGLNPTATLGCGTWGNNTISENLWWHHLVNISRIAYVIPGKVVPTDVEIWEC